MVFGAYWPLVVFTVVATITPGGATTMATASGAHFGFRRSLPLILGISFGLVSMAAAAAAGLASVLLAAPSLQFAMKALGSLYLLWLAVKIARSGPPHLNGGAARPTRFIGGVLMLLQNPKAWAMTLGAAASFATLASSPGALAVILGLAFGIGCWMSLSLWCVAGQILARLLKTTLQWRILNGVLGGLIVLSIVPMWR